MADGSSDEEEFCLDVILLHEDIDRPTGLRSRPDG